MDPNNREVVYCHQCENEWYRDEHGIICPECQSDFTEIVEADHDPRNDEQHIPADSRPNQAPPSYNDFDAPDPDEDDIDDVRLEETGPGRYRLRGTYRTTVPRDQFGQQGQGQDQGQAGAGGGLFGLVGNVLQGMLGGQAQGPQQGQIQAPNSPGRPASVPGSPPPDGQQRGGNGMFVRHGHGPGFSYTVASSSNNANFNGAELYPRNANGPQPFQPQPDHIEQMLNQMMMNIGATPGGPMGGGMRMGPGGPPFQHPDGFVGRPFIMGVGGPEGLNPVAHLFNLFGPPGGVAGDAVYSQEGLDRIVTQLMEQHQAGNAPGPASEAAIKSLPTKQISAKDQGENGKAECSICMDEVGIGGTVTILPCQHWFHFECIEAWLSEHDTCPHCRQGIMPKDGDANNRQPRGPSQTPLHDMRSSEYTRPAPSVPGAFPFARQGSGDGSVQNPFQVPDSPTLNRRSSTGEQRWDRSAGGGVFGRMRDAFSGGSNPPRDGSGGSSGSRG